MERSTSSNIETQKSNDSSSQSFPDLTRFLSNYDPVTQSLITGSFFTFGSSTSGLSTVSSKPQQTAFPGLLGVSKGSSAISFREAMDSYFKGGGTATTIYDPVMRYDYKSMGKYFKTVDEKSGIFMKDGVFFFKEKLGDHDSLQPVGVSLDSNGSLKFFGLSSGELGEEEKRFFDRLSELIKKMGTGERPEHELGQVLEQLNSGEDPAKALAELEKRYGVDKSSSDSDAEPDTEDESNKKPGGTHPKK